MSLYKILLLHETLYLSCYANKQDEGIGVPDFLPKYRGIFTRRLAWVYQIVVLCSGRMMKLF